MRVPIQIAWLRGLAMILALALAAAFVAQAQQDTAWEPTEGVDEQSEEPDEPEALTDNDCGCPSCDYKTEYVDEPNPNHWCAVWRKHYRRYLFHVNPANCDCIFGPWQYTGVKECAVPRQQ